MNRLFHIEADGVEAVNTFLTGSPNAVLDPLLEAVEKYGKY